MRCGEGCRQAHEGRPKHGEDGTDVGRQLEADELDDVLVDGSSLAHCTDDGGKVVVGKHQGGSLLGDLRAGDAHRHTDVGALERRRIIDAIARHRHGMRGGSRAKCAVSRRGRRIH
jgi:hypothetical protein